MSPLRAFLASLLLAPLVPAAVTPVGPSDVFQESGGIVVMEAERTQSSLGTGTDRWALYQPGAANYVFGAGNDAHLEFLGNSSNGGNPKAPLVYKFKINQSGYYHLHLRARARLDGAADDKNNDCYVKVTGLNGATYGPGPNAGNDHLDDASLGLLTSDTKIYGAAPNTWGWANQLDAGGSSNKRWPVYQFNAGSTYQLTVSGRSIKFNLDRIVFRKSTLVEASAKSSAVPESSLNDAPAAGPAVGQLMLVDADTDLDLGPLVDGATINLALTGPNLNLRADTSPPFVGSVRFAFDGNPALRTDSRLPYSIGGDNIADDYLPWTPSPGSHTVTATPFSGASGGGTAGPPLTVNFTVVHQLPAGSPIASAGPDKAIALPASSVLLNGSAADPGGSITAYAWNQVEGPSVATINGRSTATPTAADLTLGTYRFRLRATDGSGLSAYDDVTVTVAPAAGSPVVQAGSDRHLAPPATSVTLAGSATDPANALYFHLWTQLSGPSQATRSGETTPTLTASNLIEGTYVFRLRAFSESDLFGADDVVVTVGAATGTPAANAGPDQALAVPANSIVLNGSGTDSGGSITGYAWTQVSGPSMATFSGASTANLTAANLVQGSYVFRLTVTDNSGLTASDEVNVTVSAASGPPVAQAGSDKSITLPASSVVLNGSGTDSGGSITGYAWAQLSGPSTATLAGAATATLTASNLVQGSYVFRLTVTDNSGLTATDEATVTVAAATGGSGQAVSALMLVNADTDQDLWPLQDGGVIDFAVTGTHLNIRADTSPSSVGSVRFSLNGTANYATQSGAPYTIGGDTLDDYWSWTPPLGTLTLTATPYTSSGASGTAGTAKSVTLTVIDSRNGGFGSPVLERLAGNQIRLRYRGLPSTSYRFRRSTDLAAWFTLDTRTSGADGQIEFSDTDPPAGNAYYRLETP